MPPILLLSIVLYYKQHYRIEIKIQRPREIRIIIFTPIIGVSPSQYEIGSIENLIAFYLIPAQIPTDFHCNMWWKFCNCSNVIFGNFVCHTYHRTHRTIYRFATWKLCAILIALCYFSSYSYLSINHPSIVTAHISSNTEANAMRWCANKWLIGLFYTLWFIMYQAYWQAFIMRSVWMWRVARRGSTQAQFGSTRAQVLTKCQAYYLHIAYNMHNSATRIKWWRFCALFSYTLGKYFRSHVFYGFWVSWLFHTSVNNTLPNTVAKLHIKNIWELNNEHKKRIHIKRSCIRGLYAGRFGCFFMLIVS